MAPAASAESKAGAAASGGCFARRDHLLQIEEQVQKLWEEKRPYDVNAPVSPQPQSAVVSAEGVGCGLSSASKKNKFFCTFPYPYMNGLLHLGHGHTLCRAEFQARYFRLRGKNVLWPFALHCTGMPILACADKLKREIEAQKKQEEKKHPDEVRYTNMRCSRGAMTTE